MMTASATTTMADKAKVEKITKSTRNMPQIASSTVTPAKTTAWPEVARGHLQRLLLGASGPPLAAKAGDDEQRIVNARGQPHQKHDLRVDVGRGHTPG